jgi:signal transduction histidine kinase/PAS domain-containing protein
MKTSNSYDDLTARVAELERELAIRKKAEEELRDSKRFFADLINFLPDATLVIDTRGTVMAWNRAIEELTGIQAEDIIGKGNYEYALPFYGIRRPILIDLALKWDESVAATYQYVKKIGEILYSETLNPPFLKEPSLFWNSARKLYNARGETVGAIEVIRNITYRMVRENALQRETNNLRRILGSMRDGAFIIDAQHNVQYLNPAMIRELGTAGGRKCYAYFRHRDEPCPWCNNAEVMSGKTVQLEWYSPQSQKVYDLIDTPLHNPDGSVSKLGIIRDITRRKKSEVALRQRVLWEQLVSAVSSRFVNVSSEELDAAINKALADIGLFTGVDRSYLFCFNADLTKSSNTHEWCNQGIEPQFHQLQDLPVAKASWWMQKLKKQQIITIPSVSELPEKAAHEKEFLQSQNIQSVVAVPVRYGGKLFGFIGFDSVHEQKHWQSEDIHLLSMVGEIFAAAIVRRNTEAALQSAHTELEKKVEERTAELTSALNELKCAHDELQSKIQSMAELNRKFQELSHKTIIAMENDRKNLSKELHDSIGGSLAAIKIHLENRLQTMDEQPESGEMPLEKIAAYLTGIIQETRYIAYSLRPLSLDDLGLLPAINDEVRKFTEFHPGIHLSTHIDVLPPNISDDVSIVLYRVIQEALTNIAKHSQAANASLGLRNQDNGIHLQVHDDGCGFDSREKIHRSGFLEGYGLHSMKERVEICKGDFQIRSEPGNGTIINVFIPLHND